MRGGAPEAHTHRVPLGCVFIGGCARGCYPYLVQLELQPRCSSSFW